MSILNDLRKKATRRLRRFDEEERDNLWLRLDHGRAILERNRLLNYYLFAYGRQHSERLKRAFEYSNFQNKIRNRNIDIIDYGCGQALGTLALIDYILENKLNSLIGTIILIDPSYKALKRGKKYARKCFNRNERPDIIPINKLIDNLKAEDLRIESDNRKVHLFSNILDIDRFNIEDLVKNIISVSDGRNYFVCVSPDNEHSYRINDFYHEFRGDFSTEVKNYHHETIEQLIPDSHATSYARVFRVKIE